MPIRITIEVPAAKADAIKKAIKEYFPEKPAVFQDYRGGAGPSKEHKDENDRALLEALKAKGLKAKIVPHPLNEHLFGPHTDEFINVVKVGKRFGSYDRWGFVCGTVKGDECDQVGFDEAIEYLSKKK